MRVHQESLLNHGLLMISNSDMKPNSVKNQNWNPSWHILLTEINYIHQPSHKISGWSLYFIKSITQVSNNADIPWNSGVIQSKSTIWLATINNRTKVQRENKEHWALMSWRIKYEIHKTQNRETKNPNRNLKIYILYHCFSEHQTHPKNCSKDGELNTLEAARSDLVGEMWSWYLINLCNQ